MLRPALNWLKLVPAGTSTSARLLCKTEVASPVIARAVHLTSQYSKDRRNLRTYRQGMSSKDDGTAGEKAIDIDGLGTQDDIFPDVNTPNRLFNGIPYKELPIINIKATKNNTIMTLTDFKGSVHILKSCGTEGFRTAKKGTNIAAQTTAYNISNKALSIGVRTVRLRVQGLGPGRMAAIKGVELSGMQIVSVTDNTHVSWDPPRPRKARRV